MDYNAQLYTTDLDQYVELFTKDNVNFTGLKWKSDDDKQYYSIMINPCGYVVLEIMSPTLTDASNFKETEEIRFSFASNNNLNKLLQKNHLRALGISRATARMDEVEAFYVESIGIKKIKSHTYSDGTQHLVYMWDKPTAGIQINFISRPAKEGAAWTPKMFEDYMRDTHKKYMVSDVCGFDQYIDNHYAYDGEGGGGSGPPTDLDVYSRHVKKLGLQYHWWSQSMPSEIPFGSHWSHHPHNHRHL